MRHAVETLVILALAFALTPSAASVHDIHLYTDSTPDYVSIEDFVASVTAVWDEPEDQAIALWRWMVRTHLQAPATFEDHASVWDPMLHYGSYPNTFCGYIAAYLTAFVDVMGGDWRHRYVELADHTVCEVSWDAGATWHMFDASMNIFVRRHDGQIASCADIQAEDQCDLSTFWGDAAAQAGHLYFYHGENGTVTNPPDPDHTGQLGHESGYRSATDNPVGFVRTLRNGADSYWTFDVQTAYTHVRRGWRNRLHMRPGQVYTRHWDALGQGSEYARVDTHGEDPNAAELPLQIRGNGRWDIAPSMESADVRNGWFDLVGVAHRLDDDGAGPELRPAEGAGEARLVLKVDAANVLTSARVHVEGRRGAGDRVVLEFSRDAGCTWTEVAEFPNGIFDQDVALTSAQVGGTFDLLVRARLLPDATRQDVGLDAFAIEAITQLNRKTIPTLVRGANRVRFRSGPPQETLVLRPSLHLFCDHPASESAETWTGLTSSAEFQGYSSAKLIPTSSTVPGVATWRFDTPTDVTGFRFGGTLLARLDTPNDRVRLRSSWNGTTFTTWETFDASSSPTWNDNVYAQPTTVPAGQRSVWLQAELSSSVGAMATSTGIQDALLEVHHAPHDPAFAPVEVTWCWTEHRSNGDLVREHTRIVRRPEDLWQINVGGFRDPTMKWVRMRLADGSSVEGYGDGFDVGPGGDYDKVRVDSSWMDDVALHRPYTVSRPSSSSNPDTGGTELTDGTVIPPTGDADTFFVQGQVATWDGDDPVTVTIDLGSETTVRAIRVTSHQPNATYGHAGTITATALRDGGASETLGVIQHDDVFSPVGTHLDWGRALAANFEDLPAGGRLAHGYWLVLDAPTTARSLRLDVVPLAGRGVGLSEIEVLSDVTVSDWPDREVDLARDVTGIEDEDRAVPRARARLDVYPNPANPATIVEYEVADGARVNLRVVDLRGRVVRTLVDGWRPAGTHRARWDGRDGQGRSVASGRYLAVVDVAGHRATGDVTIVR